MTILALLSCADNTSRGGRNGACVSPNPGLRPDWVRQTPECDKTHCYFLGVSGEKHVSEGDAWNHARVSAVNRAIGSIGIVFEINAEMLKKTENQLASQSIDPTINWESYQKQKANALIRRVKNRSTYTEIIEECRNGTVQRRYYKSFELIKIEKNALKEAEEWQKNRRIYQLTRKAEQLEAEYRYHQALLKLQQAKTESRINSLSSAQSWSGIIENSITRLRQKAINQIKEALELYNLAKVRKSAGQVLECLNLLKQARYKLENGQISETAGEHLSLSAISIEEEDVINNLFLQAAGTIVPETEPEQPTATFKVKISYRKGNKEIPVNGFPVSFKYKSGSQTRLSNEKGVAKLYPLSFKAEGKYQILAKPDRERLEEPLSAQAMKLLEKKSVRFDLRVRAKTEEEKAISLVNTLRKQIDRVIPPNKKFTLTMGYFHFGNQICDIEPLNRFKESVTRQFETRAPYVIQRKIKLPKHFPGHLDPFNPRDVVEALHLNILSYQIKRIGNHLLLEAEVLFPKGRLALAKVWLRNKAFSQGELRVSCRIPKLTKWSDPVTGMKFALIRGGCFEMGGNSFIAEINEKPAHKVCLKDFYLGVYEVTQGQWKKIMKTNPSRWKKGDQYPVERTSWAKVMSFIHILNRHSSAQFDLPSEAEWEFACRGGKEATAEFGTKSGTINRGEANYGLDSGFGTDAGDGYALTAPGGQYPPNSLGIYDMSGNVMEWVKDSYFLNAYRLHVRNNPVIKKHGKNKVIRGGSYNTGWRWLRCAKRYGRSPTIHLKDVGFRLKVIK